MESVTVAAVVPAYNEEKTVGDVVRVLQRADVFDEVIVVSDGSTDGTRRAALDAGADLVHELPINDGKGRAMLHGVAHTDADVVAFFDADLIGLTENHVREIVGPVAAGSVDMHVGLRDRGKIVSSLLPLLPMVSGERALRRDVVDRMPSRFMRGYGVEVALNAYCRANGLRVGTSALKGLGIVRKDQKVGLFRGCAQYVAMWWEVLVAGIRVRAARSEFASHGAHADHDHR